MSLQGSCLCGEVSFEAHELMGIFQYCHCSRCRKFTGSAHASNIFVKPEQFRWRQGEDYVGRFEPADSKYFATGFCKQCGSSLPWHNKTNTLVVIPAGTVDAMPNLEPQRNIYWGSKAPWYKCVSEIECYDELPPRK